MRNLLDDGKLKYFFLYRLSASEMDDLKLARDNGWYGKELEYAKTMLKALIAERMAVDDLDALYEAEIAKVVDLEEQVKTLKEMAGVDVI